MGPKMLQESSPVFGKAPSTVADEEKFGKSVGKGRSFPGVDKD